MQNQKRTSHFALRTKEVNGQIISMVDKTELQALKDGEVLIKSEYSSINYKDALGVTGRGMIFKKSPMTGGIDVAGTVAESRDEKFKLGDAVLVTGCGLGESYDGGYAEFVIAHSSRIVARPAGLTAREAMTFGTAGFTALLCLERMETNGQTPDMGPILVTGASGGVGQFAVKFFAEKKYRVWAMSGKKNLQKRLLAIGAEKVVAPDEYVLAKRPLEKVQLGGVVDNVGGKILAGVIPQVELWGNVACVGLAESAELHATVMPLILRGVSLLGTSSNNTNWPLRLKIWQRLAAEFKSGLAEFVSEEIALDQIVPTSLRMLSRQTAGRILVKIS